MKNVKFILGLFFGVVITAVVFFSTSCKSETPLPGSSSTTMIKQLDSYTDVYRLDVDNVQYIVVVNRKAGGVAIVQHKMLTQ